MNRSLCKPWEHVVQPAGAAYLAKRADNRVQAIKNLAWALLASTEFCVNH
jgi:hypothetical protein